MKKKKRKKHHTYLLAIIRTMTIVDFYIIAHQYIVYCFTFLNSVFIVIVTIVIMIMMKAMETETKTTMKSDAKKKVKYP